MNQLLCIGDPSQNVMAESKGSLIAKSVSKHAGRAKEKFLQNLGKVDRTEDEIFNEHLQNFSKQQNAANKLQKEFNNYIRCVRAVQVASKSLMDTLNEMYESQWVGHDHMCTDSNNLDMLWSDYTHKLADQVLIPLNTYQAQFAETRKKIDKRNRKLVDYDSQRHSNQLVNNNSVAGGAGKKKDEAKIMKAKEQFDEVKRKFDLINTELHDELPALYNSRVLFLITNLQPYFAAEQLFHSESSKVFSEMESIVDKLATDYQHQSKMLNYFLGNKTPSNNVANNIQSASQSPASPISMNEEDVAKSPPSSPASPQNNTAFVSNSKPPSSQPDSSINEVSSVALKTLLEDESTPLSSSSPPSQQVQQPLVNGKSSSSPVNGVAPVRHENGTNKIEIDIPPGATTDNLPPGVLYRVVATYKYDAEDTDELSFEKGEIISVVPYDDPETQEEGWLIGIKDNTGEKKLFPANFTRPL
ncbi:PREDICTED: myc box-dependent-interacting protein 1 isoform X1 [Diuraphis noxia]|uniref:myc box-dependent-interacting protein 1 isoform X1 n=1 Tax=Diuraphis noxia TaxID=143948 RepID=UPI00076368DE|nr:PREDICTED: myc box-dependent-interacting protein 1 isoform X1 [Diuraphis noxia]